MSNGTLTVSVPQSSLYIFTDFTLGQVLNCTTGVFQWYQRFSFNSTTHTVMIPTYMHCHDLSLISTYDLLFSAWHIEPSTVWPHPNFPVQHNLSTHCFMNTLYLLLSLSLSSYFPPFSQYLLLSSLAVKSQILFKLQLRLLLQKLLPNHSSSQSLLLNLQHLLSTAFSWAFVMYIISLVSLWPMLLINAPTVIYVCCANYLSHQHY